MFYTRRKISYVYEVTRQHYRQHW